MHFIFGLLNLPIWAYVVVTVAMMHFTIMGVTLYLHRDQTHRGLDLHPAVQHVFRFWLWLTTAMVTRQWVAVHRKHHARCETEEDPHSPQILGLRKVLLEGAELYRVEARNPETVEKYGRGAPDDWIERNLYSRWPLLGVVLMAAIDIVLMGAPGISIWGVQMMTIPLLAAGVVNGVGHYWGYRNYECKDAATNVMPVGIIMGGEELHNNHHAFPSSARFSMRPWEFDIGWLYISVLKAVGLAKVRRVAPRPVIERGKAADLDTVRAVLLNRLHVLRHYSHQVIQPVLEDESRRQPMLAKARKLLVRDSSLLDEKARKRLSATLHDSRALRTVYEYRQQLQELWEGTAHNNEKLLQQFRDWCARAEASGIQSLQEFARQLEGYRTQPQPA
ncbi:MAG TPA: fatty acid desaturase [Gammaproteobacteria bacterium]|nr:fatty acid desaturase [Gammaproteobacteria bacterium]